MGANKQYAPGLPRDDAGAAVRALNVQDKHLRPCQEIKKGDPMNPMKHSL